MYTMGLITLQNHQWCYLFILKDLKLHWKKSGLTKLGTTSILHYLNFAPWMKENKGNIERQKRNSRRSLRSTNKSTVTTVLELSKTLERTQIPKTLLIMTGKFSRMRWLSSFNFLKTSCLFLDHCPHTMRCWKKRPGWTKNMRNW